ncbi:MAG: hypothetical protein V3R49_06890 [Gammaproteobacteria bacterium]|jgi:acyl carrier protein
MDASSLISEISNRALTLSPDTRLDSISELDSLGVVNLVIRLEALIDRQLSESEMEGLLTVKNVEDLLQG